MKKIIAIFLASCILCLLFIVPTGAAGEVFVSTGNTVLPLTNAMPQRSNGAWYIDYQCFTKGNLGVSSSYNAAQGMLVLYNWDTTLIFDLNKTVAYTAAEKILYKAVSYVSAGTVYVPVQFTAQMLGLEYAYFSELPMIRIKKSSDIPNNMFLYIAKNAIPDLLAEYNKSKTQNSISSPEDPSNNTEKEDVELKNIRLTFNITSGKNMKTILDALSRYGYRATFFIQGSAIDSCRNEIRRAVAERHTLGSLSENGSSDFSSSEDKLKAALAGTNEKLFDTARTKTRIVRVIDGSKTLTDEKKNLIISLGYRIWDDTATPQGSSANRIYNSTVSLLNSQKKSTATLTLSDSDAAVSALPRILRYLNSNNYRAYTISVLDTPVNDISEKR